ncbi:MAG: hypothetical protein WC532_06745 [Candidatus Omnitrophota bacterium]
MRKMVVLALVGVFCVISAAYAETATIPDQPAIRKLDMNKDGKPDVAYYSDGKSIVAIKADTDHNGKLDVIVHLKDGQFDSAEIDNNNDGKSDQTFSNVDEFNKWLKDNHPDFYGYIGQPDWQFNLLKP